MYAIFYRTLIIFLKKVRHSTLSKESEHLLKYSVLISLLHRFSFINFALYNFIMADERYNLRGVSAGKEDVHNAIKNVDKGLFPQAFCKIVPDHLSNDEDYCIVMHADGAGTKSALAYM